MRPDKGEQKKQLENTSNLTQRKPFTDCVSLLAQRKCKIYKPTFFTNTYFQSKSNFVTDGGGGAERYFESEWKNTVSIRYVRGTVIVHASRTHDQIHFVSCGFDRNRTWQSEFTKTRKYWTLIQLKITYLQYCMVKEGRCLTFRHSFTISVSQFHIHHITQTNETQRLFFTKFYSYWFFAYRNFQEL